MGRRLLLIGYVAAVAAACGDSTSDGTPGGGSGGQSAGSGGKSVAGTPSGGKAGSAGTNATGGTMNDAGSPAAGETSLGGAGPAAGGAGNQAGESSTTGGDGALAGEGGAGPLGMAGEPSSSAGSPGMAGAPSEGGAPGCVNATPRYIAGSLGGEVVDYGVFSGGSYHRNMPLPKLFDWRARVGTDGLLHIWGPTTIITVGESAAVQAHLLTASEGPNPGTHYCSASGSMERVDTFRYAGALSDWTELGTCPANPGTGSLSGCFEQTSLGAVVACADDQFRLVGTIGNTAIDASYNANTVNKEGSIDANTFLAFGNGGLLMLSTVSNVGSGYLMLPDDGPSPGLVVCIGTATLTPGALSDRYTFTLGSLGVVGTCPGATGVGGTLDGCL